jgi:hypothetical protein
MLAPGLLCKLLGVLRVISDQDVVKQSSRFNLPQLNADVLQTIKGVD